MKGRIEVYFYNNGDSSSSNLMPTENENISIGEDTPEVQSTALSSVGKGIAIASAVAVASVMAIQKVASSAQTYVDLYADYTGDYLASNNLRNVNAVLGAITNPFSAGMNAIRHAIDVKKANINADFIKSKTGNSIYDNSKGGDY